jgi:CheY-like chemotaxis protein
VTTQGLPDGHLLGDVRRLRQVLDNLLGNAVKFTREGGVHLTVRGGPGTRLRFEVEDTGPGIGAADLKRLFRPFEQAADGRPSEPGTGLGLAIAQHLVGLMGGRIEVDSTPGRGSRFRFEIALPPAGKRPQATEARRIGYDGPRRHVLVVDDLETSRRVFREMLEGLGFSVTEAASGEAALSQAGERRFDLALLDLRLPGMGGLELAARLRASHPDTKLVATSASTFALTRDEVLGAGADDFLPKPFQEAQLVEIAGRLLGLAWRREPPAAATPPAPRGGAEPTREDLAPLRDAASRGDIVALRDRLAALRARRPDLAPFIGELEALASDYRMEAIRKALGSVGV